MPEEPPLVKLARAYEEMLEAASALERLRQEFITDVKRHGVDYAKNAYIPITHRLAPTRALEATYLADVKRFLERQLTAPSLRRLYDDAEEYRSVVAAVRRQLDEIVQCVDDPL